MSQSDSHLCRASMQIFLEGIRVLLVGDGVVNDGMRSPVVRASHWKLINAETFKTSFQIRCYIIKFASLDFSGPAIQQSELTFFLIWAYIVLS